MKINNIKIKNFKSIHDMSFKPGRVNVLIGSNGCGKTTILEALGMTMLAMNGELNDNGIIRKGIRLSVPKFYKTSLEAIPRNNTLGFSIDWEDNNEYSYNTNLYVPSEKGEWRYHSENFSLNGIEVAKAGLRSKIDFTISCLRQEMSKNGEEARLAAKNIGGYAIYQPSTLILRGNISDFTQVAPLGLGGGRLAEAIEDLLYEKDGDLYFGGEYLDDILELIGWAENIKIAAPKKSTLSANVATTRRVVEFEDKYMRKNDFFTAYDANEGALYVLFMICLALHSKTPKVFAFDNFDQALNPVLARSLTKRFCEYVKKYDKVAFLTTHNPLVLDGLNLLDEDIRLWSVSKDEETGETKIKRIVVSKGLLDKKMTLSRLWVNGYLGSIPEL